VVCALDPSFGDAIPEILWTTTRDGALDYANRAWIERTGVSADDASGEGWLLAVHEEDRTRVRAAWDHALATFEPFDIELRLRAPDHGDAPVQGGKRHGSNGAGEPGAASHR